MKRRSILFFCFGISLFLHALALVFFQRYSLWFSSSEGGHSEENWLSLIDKKERDQILKSTFDPVTEEESCSGKFQPMREEEGAFSVKTQMRQIEIEWKDCALFQFSFPKQELSLIAPVWLTFSVPSRSFNLLEHLPKDLILPAPTRLFKPIFPLPTETSLALKTKHSFVDESPKNLIPYTDELNFSLVEPPQKGKALIPVPVANLSKLPTLDELDTSSYSESFDAELTFLPKEGEKGYLFALTLVPRPDLDLPRLRQHLTFLIDRSNSIQQGRLVATKSAVHKALESLNPDDAFNIIAFDSKMDKMSPHYQPCVAKSYALAEDFLEKIQLGSFFSSIDLYKPLFLTVPSQLKEDEIHTVILFTDAEALSKRGIQKALLSDWTSYNAGRVSLFAVGMNDLNLPKLDVITALNRGKTIHAPSHRGMKRKLLKLLKMIQTPIAKDISCHAISKAPSGTVIIFPNTSQMPHLYLDQPYVILGETDTLDDFVLFVQGRLKNRWLNIKKTISFLNAKKGNKSLRQELALQRAYKLYEQFCIDDNPKHIADAQALLQPFDISLAF